MQSGFMRTFGEVRIIQVRDHAREFVEIASSAAFNDLGMRQELRHANFNGVLTYEEQQSHRGLLRMYYFEYLDVSMEDVLRQRKQQNLRFPEDDLVKIMREVLECLVYLQTRGTFAGAVTPSTLFHDGVDNCIKLYDTAVIFGTEGEKLGGYCAPEVLQLERKSQTDRHASEIFQLGLTMLEIASFLDSANLCDETNKRIDVEEMDKRINIVRRVYSQRIVRVISDMLTMNPKQRPSASMLLGELFASFRDENFAAIPSVKPTLPPLRITAATRNITFAADSSSGRGTTGRSTSPIAEEEGERNQESTTASATWGGGADYQYIATPLSTSHNSFRKFEEFINIITPRQSVIQPSPSSSPLGLRKNNQPPSFNQIDSMIQNALLGQKRPGNNDKLHNLSANECGGGESKAPSPRMLVTKAPQQYFGRQIPQIQKCATTSNNHTFAVAAPSASAASSSQSFAQLLKKRWEFSNKEDTYQSTSCQDEVGGESQPVNHSPNASFSKLKPVNQQVDKKEERLNQVRLLGNNQSTPSLLQRNQQKPGRSSIFPPSYANQYAGGLNNNKQEVQLNTAVKFNVSPPLLVSPTKINTSGFSSVPLSPKSQQSPTPLFSPFKVSQDHWKPAVACHQQSAQLNIQQSHYFLKQYKNPPQSATNKSQANNENVSPVHVSKAFQGGSSFICQPSSFNMSSIQQNNQSMMQLTTATASTKQLKKPVPKITVVSNNNALTTAVQVNSSSNRSVSPLSAAAIGGNSATTITQAVSYLQSHYQQKLYVQASPISSPTAYANFMRDRSMIQNSLSSQTPLFSQNQSIKQQQQQQQPQVNLRECAPQYKSSQQSIIKEESDSSSVTTRRNEQRKLDILRGIQISNPAKKQSQMWGDGNVGLKRLSDEACEVEPSAVFSPSSVASSSKHFTLYSGSSARQLQHSDVSSQREDTQRKPPSDRAQQQMNSIGDLDKRLEMIIQKNLLLTQNS